MTVPLPFDPPTPRVSRANWLGRYLETERGFDDRLKLTLTDALDGIDEAFTNLTDGFSKRVRRQQLAASKRSVREVLSHVFGVEREIIKESSGDAAIAAVDAQLYDDRGILGRIFKNPVDRQQYADSLRASASRGVENVVSRTLFSEKPLAESVYRTEALANNLVGQQINRALARGDSARDLAKSVKNLIDPNVKGGVSYAAERLGRTELNNAFHATSIASAQDTPWVQAMDWNLSKVHASDPGDECETYALQKTFAIGQVPGKPHPNCRCYVTPKQDYDSFENALLGGQYDSYLDDVLGVEDTRTARELIGPEFPEGTTDRLKVEYEKALAKGQTSLYPPKGASPAEKRAAQKLTVKLQNAQLAKESTQQAVTEAARKASSRKRLVDPVIPKSLDTAENSTQVANYLSTRYEGLEIQGFDFEDVDVRAAQQIAEGFETRIKKHPGTNFRALKIVDDLPEHVAGETRFNADQKGFSDIVFNHTHVANYDRAVRELKARKGTGFFSAKARPDDSKPFYYTTVHEWGHVLDYSGKGELSDSLHPKGKEKVGKGLIRRWYKTFRKPSFVLENSPSADADILPALGPEDVEAYEDWVIDGLPSGYSYRDEKRLKIHNEEMIAESYLEFMSAGTEKSSVATQLVQEVAAIAKRNKKIAVRSVI